MLENFDQIIYVLIYIFISAFRNFLILKKIKLFKIIIKRLIFKIKYNRYFYFNFILITKNSYNEI